MTQLQLSVAAAAVFLWIGFVCAISFMEAWLKFRARGMTIVLGLEIGRLVFRALNRVEWIFAAVTGVVLVISRGYEAPVSFLYYIPVFLLLLQTAWLLPALDARAELRIRGAEMPSSKLHFYYVAMEMTKVSCLFIFAFYLFSPKS